MIVPQQTIPLPSSEARRVRVTSLFSLPVSACRSFGVDGHVCLLRTICDVAEQPFQDDGVLGDVLNTVMA